MMKKIKTGNPIRITIGLIILLSFITILNISNGNTTISPVNGFSYDLSISSNSDNVISTNEGYNYEPSTFFDQNNHLWVIWCNSSNSNGEIWATYANSPYDYWIEPIKISDDPNDDWNPSILIDSNNIIWIFWQSNRLNSYDIWYKNSTNNGVSWSQAYFLMNTTANEKDPSVLIDSSNVFWVYYTTDVNGNSDVAYRRSLNNGIDWEEEQIISISSSVINEELCDVSLGIDGTKFILVQELHAKWGLFLWKLDEDTWNRHQITSLDNSERGTLSSKNNDMILVVYVRNMRFFSRESDSLGEEWTDEVEISDESFQGQHPKSIVDENNTLILFWSSIEGSSSQIHFSVFSKKDIDIGPLDELILEILSGGNLALYGGLAVLGILAASIFLVKSSTERNYSYKTTIPKDLTRKQEIGFTLLTIFSQIIYPPQLRKLKNDDVKENKTRELILLLLTEKKFMHLREIQRKAHLGSALVKWHLQVLEDFGLIKSISHKRFLIYFLSHKKPNEKYILVYFMLKPVISYSLVQHLKQDGVWTLDKLISLTNETRKKVRYHLRRLHKNKLILQEDEDNYRLNPLYKEWVNVVINEKPYDFLAEI